MVSHVAEHQVSKLLPRNCGQPVTACGLLRDSRAISDVSELRHRMASDGYLYLPQLLDRQQVMEARREVLARLRDAGYMKAPPS